MFKSRVALCGALLLNGCMMPGMMGMGGMGGMHGMGGMGGMPAGAAMEPTVIKEAVVGDMRVTAAFPSLAVGDSVAYTVTVARVMDRSPVTDAVVSLVVSADDGRGAAMPAGQAHAHSAARDSTLAAHERPIEPTRWTAVQSGGGSYVFHPVIPANGAHRVVVVVARIGNRVLDPAIELEHVVQLQPRMDQHAGGGGPTIGWGATTLVIAGAVAMGIMMIVAVR